MIPHTNQIAETLKLFTGPKSYAVVLMDSEIARQKNPTGGKGREVVVAAFVTQNTSIMPKNPSQPQAIRTATCSTCCAPGG